jgi:succinate dehydrogenase / fumarate reductase membrane anchor subunit
VQHYDHQVASVTTDVVAEQGAMPTYPEEAQEAVRARLGDPNAEVTPYDVVMQRLADPVYAVLWKGFNILFLITALHHGFYGLNNVLTDYIRNDMGKMVAKTLSWSLALVLLVIGMYSVITAGW